MGVFGYVCDGHYCDNRSAEETCLGGEAGPLPALVQVVDGFRPIAPREVGCWVTVRLGRVCIVNFRVGIPDLPDSERLLSRYRVRGGVFRAGWTVNQPPLYPRSELGFVCP
jgi:hypothetical protein